MMIKPLSFAAVACLAATLTATAQTSDVGGPGYARRHPRSVEVNGRCGGVSYGTGARRCGTRTGGPVGGISGRN